MQGTGELSKASVFPRSSPAHFPEYTGSLADISANLSPNVVGHARNLSVWCYDEEDLIDLLSQKHSELDLNEVAGLYGE